MVGQKTETADSRRIDITQFLHLAVVCYQQTQSGSDADGAPVDSFNGSVFQTPGAGASYGNGNGVDTSLQGASMSGYLSALSKNEGGQGGHADAVDLTSLAQGGEDDGEEDEMAALQTEREKEFLGKFRDRGVREL